MKTYTEEFKKTIVELYEAGKKQNLNQLENMAHQNVI